MLNPSPHPYLRAYMAGITAPCFLLLFVIIGFTLARHVYHVSVPLERVIVFPMAIAPNAWGLWNVLYVARHTRWRPPIGVHGALLACLFAPMAYAVTRLAGFEVPEPLTRAFPVILPAGVAIYYLLWKHVVRFLNELLGIA